MPANDDFHNSVVYKALSLPFGMQRTEEGYLESSEAGAWRMPDGQHQPGCVDLNTRD